MFGTKIQLILYCYWSLFTGCHSWNYFPITLPMSRALLIAQEKCHHDAFVWPPFRINPFFLFSLCQYYYCFSNPKLPSSVSRTSYFFVCFLFPRKQNYFALAVCPGWSKPIIAILLWFSDLNIYFHWFLCS